MIVTGPPASGKSTLAARLARDLSLPAITKDGIKEVLLDAIGAVDVESSRRVGRAAWTVFWQLVEVEAAAGRSVIVEGNIARESGELQLTWLAERYDIRPLQVHCFAPIEVLYRRYEQRIGERHPGHGDADRLPALRPSLDPSLYRLLIHGALISVDTSSFDDVDYESIRQAVQVHLDTA